MSEVFGSFGENVNLGNTDAEQAVEFAFEYQDAPENADQTQIAAKSLQSVVTELQQPDQIGSINQREKKFDDGSILTVSVIQPTEGAEVDELFGPLDKIHISFTTRLAAEPQRMASVTYRIPHEADKVIGCSDRTLGMKLAAAFELVDSLNTNVLAMTDSATDDLLGGLFLEAVLMGDGIDPSIDTDVEDLRNVNDDYRTLSDSIREANAGEELAKTMGLTTERLVGSEEIRRLTQLLQSF